MLLELGADIIKLITDFWIKVIYIQRVGLSFGPEPIYTILKETLNSKPLIDIYLVPLDTNIETLKLAKSLRDEGIKVLIERIRKKFLNVLNMLSMKIFII